MSGYVGGALRWTWRQSWSRSRCAAGRIDAFFASDGAPPRDDTAELVVRAAVDYGADRTGGDPVRWSPKVVGLFRLEWVDGDPPLSPEVRARLPEVLRAWVAFAAARRGVGPHGTARALAAVDADL